jgi:CRISPR/Cas system-associated exonuclease Cas4 (RecB family)
MRASENPVAAEIFVLNAHEANEALHPRAPGMHATDLIYCLRKAWYEHKKFPKPLPGVKELSLWLTGHGHHQMLQLQDPGQGDLEATISLQCLIGGTQHAHPITMNLDFLDETVAFPGVPTEIKSTRKSSLAKPPEFSWYLEQLITYLLRWGQLDALTLKYYARLHVLFLNGDYRENRTPILKTWDLEVSLEELRLWHAELTLRIHAILNDTPPTPERYEWECDYCPYASPKGGPCEQPVLAKGRGGDKTGIKRVGFFHIEDLLATRPPEVESGPDLDDPDLADFD